MNKVTLLWVASLLLLLTVAAEKVAYASKNTAIRSVDFANFTYPGDTIFGKKRFELRNGQFAGGNAREPISLLHVGYGDVTGDGKDEAFVSLVVTVQGGTARPHLNYVYAISNGRLKLLWVFDTGDRADGGLRRIFAEDGRLVVDRYSPEGSKGDCCPAKFKRTHYQWNGRRFVRSGMVETLPHPEGYGFPVMQPYFRKEARFLDSATQQVIRPDCSIACFSSNFLR